MATASAQAFSLVQGLVSLATGNQNMVQTQVEVNLGETFRQFSVALGSPAAALGEMMAASAYWRAWNFGSSSPVGLVVPDFVDQIYVRFPYYRAVGLDSSAWVPINNPPMG